MPQCALATGPLPSTRSSLALTASSFAVSSVLPGHPTAHILASHDSCVIRLVARGPPLLLTRRFRANMSSPMFRGRLCVHKEVYDHGGGQRIWHIDTSPVAFDSLDNLGLHEFVALSRLNTLSKRLLFTLHPSVTGEDAKLATGLRAPDFPGRTFTGKSTSAFHGAPRLATGLRAADFPDRTFTGKSTSALHGALPGCQSPVAPSPIAVRALRCASANASLRSPQDQVFVLCVMPKDAPRDASCASSRGATSRCVRAGTAPLARYRRPLRTNRGCEPFPRR